MNIRLTTILALSIMCLLVFNIVAQNRPNINFYELLISAEENPSMKTEARKVALENNTPWSIYLPEKIFIEALVLKMVNRFML